MAPEKPGPKPKPKAPKPVKEGIGKDEVAKIRKMLEDAGASVEVQ